MDPKNENPSFVAVTGGKIVAVERHKNKMGKYIGRKTQVVNLQKKTLIPGLVDSHSHFSMTASRLAQGFNLTPPPFGTVTSIPMLLDAVKAYVVANNIPAGQPIAGTGYIDIDMAEHRHPTRYELDTISTVHPIVLSHFSGHIVVANSLAMELIGYQNSSSGPAGGIIDAFPNGTVTGVCREYAILPLLGKFGLSFAKLTPAQIQDATNHYFSSGVTTAQDLLMSEVEPMVYHSLGDSFPLEVNGYFWVSGPNLTTFQKVLASYNTTRFKTRGVKFLLDGSIQGYTGLLTQPFWVPQSMYSGDLSNYTYNSSRSCSTESCGSDLFPAPTLLRSLFKTFINSNIDIHAHTVGDGASENMLNAV
jgi:predicted amidohydrolase YtcJ